MLLHPAGSLNPPTISPVYGLHPPIFPHVEREVEPHPELKVEHPELKVDLAQPKVDLAQPNPCPGSHAPASNTVLD